MFSCMRMYKLKREFELKTKAKVAEDIVDELFEYQKEKALAAKTSISL